MQNDLIFISLEAQKHKLMAVLLGALKTGWAWNNWNIKLPKLRFRVFLAWAWLSNRPSKQPATRDFLMHLKWMSVRVKYQCKEGWRQGRRAKTFIVAYVSRSQSLIHRRIREAGTQEEDSSIFYHLMERLQFIHFIFRSNEFYHLSKTTQFYEI